MSTLETNTYQRVHDQSDSREHDIEKAYNTAHYSAKRAKKLANQAEKMLRNGHQSDIAKEPFLQQFKRGRNKYDDPYSTQLATNAELKQRGSNTQVEYKPGERDEFGFKNEDDIIKLVPGDSPDHNN